MARRVSPPLPPVSEDEDDEVFVRPWRGYERLRLFRDLALGEFTPEELARRYEVNPIDIENFKEDFSNEIAEVKLALEGELSIDLAGLWITKKPNRLAEYQSEAEEIRDYLEDLRQQNIRWSRSHRDMLRSYLEILRAVAEELGAYPQRHSEPARTGQTVHYVIETGDTDKLT